MPLHRMHNMLHEPVGYIENFRILPNEKIDGEWILIGDVTVLSGTLDETMKGFSISYLDKIKYEEGCGISVYIPFPAYNDKEFMDELLQDNEIGVGKWKKKSYNPETVMLIVSSVIIPLCAPIWDSVYKEHVAPSLRRFFNNHKERLLNKELRAEIVQIIDFDGAQVEVRFMPPIERKELFLSEIAINNGIKVVREFLESKREEGVRNITRIVMEYDLYGRSYKQKRYDCSHDV